MIKILNYFLLQCKRVIKLLPGTLLATVLIVGGIFVGVYAYIFCGSYAAGQQRFEIGIVKNEDDSILNLGLDLIQRIDDTKYMVEIKDFADEKSAASEMRKNQISAYVVLTPEFVESLDHMENDVTARYYSSSGDVGISSIVMDEVSGIASNIILYTDGGILAMRQYMRTLGYSKKEISKATNSLLMSYLESILSRDKLYEVEEIGISSGLSTVVYYFTTMLLFIILILSFCGLLFFQGEKNALYQSLKSQGLGAIGQIVTEYLVFFLLNFFAVLLVVEFMFGAVNYMGLELADYGLFRFIDAGYLLVRFLPVVALFSSMTFMFFECFTDSISRILVPFLTYLLMSYLSGYFYPQSFFPELAQKIGNSLPTGVAFSYAGTIVTGSDASCWHLAFFVGLFLTIAVLCRRYKIVSG